MYDSNVQCRLAVYMYTLYDMYILTQLSSILVSAVQGYLVNGGCHWSLDSEIPSLKTHLTPTIVQLTQSQSLSAAVAYTLVAIDHESLMQIPRIRNSLKTHLTQYS